MQWEAWNHRPIETLKGQTLCFVVVVDSDPQTPTRKHPCTSNFTIQRPAETPASHCGVRSATNSAWHNFSGQWLPRQGHFSQSCEDWWCTDVRRWARGKRGSPLQGSPHLGFISSACTSLQQKKLPSSLSSLWQILWFPYEIFCLLPMKISLWVETFSPIFWYHMSDLNSMTKRLVNVRSRTISRNISILYTWTCMWVSKRYKPHDIRT